MMSQVQENGSLLFSAVEKQDEAEYRCKVTQIIIMTMMMPMMMLMMTISNDDLKAKNMYGVVQSPSARLRVEAGQIIIVKFTTISTIIVHVIFTIIVIVVQVIIVHVIFTIIVIVTQVIIVVIVIIIVIILII